MAGRGASHAAGEGASTPSGPVYVIPVVLSSSHPDLGSLGSSVEGFALGAPAFALPIYSLSASTPAGAAAGDEAPPRLGGVNAAGRSEPPGGGGAAPALAGGLNPASLSGPPAGAPQDGGGQAPVGPGGVNAAGLSGPPEAAPAARPGRRSPRSHRSG